MKLFHALAHGHHRSARPGRFNAVPASAPAIRSPTQHYVQQGNTVPAEHEFYAEVFGQLERIGQVVVTGSPAALADFRDYVDKHRPQAASHIAAYDAVDHPSEAQLAALARKHFDVKVDPALRSRA